MPDGYSVDYAFDEEPLTSERTAITVDGSNIEAIELPASGAFTSLSVINTQEGMYGVSKQWASGSERKDVTVHVYRYLTARALKAIMEKAGLTEAPSGLAVGWTLYDNGANIAATSTTLNGSNNWYTAFSLPSVPTAAELGLTAEQYAGITWGENASYFDYAIIEKSVDGFTAAYTDSTGNSLGSVIAAFNVDAGSYKPQENGEVSVKPYYIVKTTGDAATSEANIRFATITNSPGGGYKLPETGGAGTEPLYAAGAALLAGAAVIFVLRRRKEGMNG